MATNPINQRINSCKTNLCTHLVVQDWEEIRQLLCTIPCSQPYICDILKNQHFLHYSPQDSCRSEGWWVHLSSLFSWRHPLHWTRGALSGMSLLHRWLPDENHDLLIFCYNNKSVSQNEVSEKHKEETRIVEGVKAQGYKKVWKQTGAKTKYTVEALHGNLT